MNVYHYDQIGLYINTTEAKLHARKSARLGEAHYICPAFATLVEPMARTETHVPLFSNGVWTLVPDVNYVIPLTAEEQAIADAAAAAVLAAQELAIANQTHLDYLNSTDWYVIRLTETGVAVPAEVTAARAAARAAIA